MSDTSVNKHRESIVIVILVILSTAKVTFYCTHKHSQLLMISLSATELKLTETAVY